MVFSVKRHREYHPPLYFDNVEIEQVTSHKHLGLTLTPTLSCAKHIENICNMAKRRLGTIRHVSNKLPRPTLEHLYVTLVRPIMEYACIVWGNLS